MVDKILEMSQQQMVERGMPEDQLETAMNMTRKFMTPGWMFLFTILTYTFVGFLLSLFISIFMKRNQENPFNSTLQ